MSHPPGHGSPLRAQFRPVEFFLELMKRVVADLFRLAQRQDRAPRRGDGAAAQRIGRQFAGGDAAVGIAFGAQQQRAIFQPQDFGFLRRIAVDLVERRAIGDGAGAGDLGATGFVVLEVQRR